MTYEEFVDEYNRLLADDREKAAVILAGLHPEHYAQYAAEWIGEEDE